MLCKKTIFFFKIPQVHEVIITSPLGIVPRELELMYPASRYDIAVSGYWDEDEKKMIQNLLQRYLETCDYEKIIVHVPRSIQDFIVDLLKNPIITCTDSPTSKETIIPLTRMGFSPGSRRGGASTTTITERSCSATNGGE